MNIIIASGNKDILQELQPLLGDGYTYVSDGEEAMNSLNAMTDEDVYIYLYDREHPLKVIVETFWSKEAEVRPMEKYNDYWLNIGGQRPENIARALIGFVENQTCFNKTIACIRDGLYQVAFKETEFSGGHGADHILFTLTENGKEIGEVALEEGYDYIFRIKAQWYDFIQHPANNNDKGYRALHDTLYAALERDDPEFIEGITWGALRIYPGCRNCMGWTREEVLNGTYRKAVSEDYLICEFNGYDPWGYRDHQFLYGINAVHFKKGRLKVTIVSGNAGLLQEIAHAINGISDLITITPKTCVPMPMDERSTRHVSIALDDTAYPVELLTNQYTGAKQIIGPEFYQFDAIFQVSPGGHIETIKSTVVKYVSDMEKVCDCIYYLRSNTYQIQKDSVYIWRCMDKEQLRVHLQHNGKLVGTLKYSEDKWCDLTMGEWAMSNRSILSTNGRWLDSVWDALKFALQRDVPEAAKKIIPSFESPSAPDDELPFD